MAYDAKAIANFFLELAKNEGKSLTPMKLQKLIFFAHGWSLGLFDEPLIAETVEAWRFGPVVPSIYHEFKHFRSGAIGSKATSLNFENFKMFEPLVPLDDKKTADFLERVWQVYGGFSAIDLSNMTHAQGSPWQRAWSQGGNGRSIPIDDNLIRDYFKDQATRNREQHAA
jgi:uncharacterized phage-associated protein